MKKTFSIIKTALSIIVVLILIWFLLISIGTPIILYLNNLHLINNCNLVIIIYFSICVVFSLSFTVILFVSSRRYNKLSKFINKHIFAFISFIVLLAIFSIAIYNSSNIDLSVCNNLIGVEWAIFGLSIAVFLFKIQNQEVSIEKASNLDPDETYGKKRLEQVEFIINLKEEFSQVNIVLIFIIINALSLLMFSGGFFLMDKEKNKDTLSLLFTISLLFTTNTFLQVFLDVVRSYRNKKKMLMDKSHMKIEYDDLFETFTCLFEEDVVDSKLKDIDSDITLSQKEKEDKKAQFILEYICETKKFRRDKNKEDSKKAE